MASKDALEEPRLFVKLCTTLCRNSARSKSRTPLVECEEKVDGSNIRFVGTFSTIGSGLSTHKLVLPKLSVVQVGSIRFMFTQDRGVFPRQPRPGFHVFIIAERLCRQLKTPRLRLPGALAILHEELTFPAGTISFVTGFINPSRVGIKLASLVMNMKSLWSS